MTIGFYCNREVVITDAATTVLDAARLMRTQHVGTLVVTEKSGNILRPTGLITDRDLVLSVMALELKPETILVSDIMQEPLYTVREDQSVIETIRIMRGYGVRRIPVVDLQGALQGLVSLDDLIELLAIEMQELSKIIVNQKARESSLRK